MRTPTEAGPGLACGANSWVSALGGRLRRAPVGKGCSPAPYTVAARVAPELALESAAPGLVERNIRTSCRLYGSVLTIVLKVDRTLVSMVPTAPMTTTEIRAAIRPYSIAVAPDSFFSRLW